MSTSPPDEKFVLTASRNFSEWLAGTGASLVFSTYQAGKLFFLGLRPDGGLAVFERSFERAMGIAPYPDRRSLLLATRLQLLRFDDVLAPGEKHDQHDALFVPHQAWITGDLDVHEVAVQADGALLFVNTLFSCLATISDGYSFKPVWKPGFISRLAPEDRCHLNGLAMDKGRPRAVSLAANSDVGDGWRDRRADGGMLIDVASGETILDGLSMPHSPRFHDGRLWLLDSGSGRLGFCNGGIFEPVAFCPGYARGLAFIGRHAVIGLSLPRADRTFQGLPLDAALASHGAEARCGLIVVDTASGNTVCWVRVEGIVRELFDVAVLPGIRNPAALGFKTDELARVISIDER
jgi:uncharacterized protein (TIGR03032 family)